MFNIFERSTKKTFKYYFAIGPTALNYISRFKYISSGMEGGWTRLDPRKVYLPPYKQMVLVLLTDDSLSLKARCTNITSSCLIYIRQIYTYLGVFYNSGLNLRFGSRGR